MKIVKNTQAGVGILAWTHSFQSVPLKVEISYWYQDDASEVIFVEHSNNQEMVVEIPVTGGAQLEQVVKDREKELMNTFPPGSAGIWDLRSSKLAYDRFGKKFNNWSYKPKICTREIDNPRVVLMADYVGNFLICYGNNLDLVLGLFAQSRSSPFRSVLQQTEYGGDLAMKLILKDWNLPMVSYSHYATRGPLPGHGPISVPETDGKSIFDSLYKLTASLDVIKPEQGAGTVIEVVPNAAQETLPLLSPPKTVTDLDGEVPSEEEREEGEEDLDSPFVLVVDEEGDEEIQVDLAYIADIGTADLEGVDFPLEVDPSGFDQNLLADIDYIMLTDKDSLSIRFRHENRATENFLLNLLGEDFDIWFLSPNRQVHVIANHKIEFGDHIDHPNPSSKKGEK